MDRIRRRGRQFRVGESDVESSVRLRVGEGVSARPASSAARVGLADRRGVGLEGEAAARNSSSAAVLLAALDAWRSALDLLVGGDDSDEELEVDILLPVGGCDE